jgi:chlorobactene glucosyltransferase
MSKQGRARSIVWPILVAIGQIVNGWRAKRNYLSLPEVLPVDSQKPPYGEHWPGVSIIVPARDEEMNLPRLLNSLVAQDYPLYEVIVVDDASTDGTVAVVRRYEAEGVRLLSTDGPPKGWTGKNAACWRGAEASHYPWLLFIDADTELAPLALRSSLHFALAQQRQALSLFTQQRCETLWERLLLPFAYQQYFVGINARHVHAAGGPSLANGQYFLISRAIYQQVGGHAANAQSIIDDVALATSLKKAGVIPLACRGEALVAVRMYIGLRAIIAGFGKNSYLFLCKSPLTGIQTALSTALAASVLTLLLDGWRKRSWHLVGVAIVAYIAQVCHMQFWLHRFGVSLRYALLAPFSALGFLAIALNSMVRGRTLAWKGRRYRFVRVRYRLPRRWMLDMGRALLFNVPRSIVEDSRLAVEALPKPPCIEGTGHIPLEGSFVLVSNHYQRLDLWIGWSGALLIDAIAQRRKIAMHYVTTDRARIGRFTVPGTRWLIERVATVWDLVLVTPPALLQGRTEGQRYALLRMLRMLQHDKGMCFAIMPEGDEGTATGLIEAMPGSGRALYALSSRGLPLLPAAVWEEDGRLHAHFGEPLHLLPKSQFVIRNADELDGWARTLVMRRIAALLPPMLRGKYGRVEDGTLG